MKRLLSYSLQRYFYAKKVRKNFANFFSESRLCDLIVNLRILGKIDFQQVLFQIILLKHL